jgi:hypothetical protein
MCPPVLARALAGDSLFWMRAALYHFVQPVGPERPKLSLSIAGVSPSFSLRFTLKSEPLQADR